MGGRVIDAVRVALAARERKTWPMVPGLKAAAVLVPLVIRGDDVGLVFTERSKDLRAHSGQISFPGGKSDPGDIDASATALREAEEEIGIVPAHVQILGALDEVLTPTGFRITPVVGHVTIPAELAPTSPEVARVFELPLARLRDPAVFHEEGLFPAFGRMVNLFAYRVDGWRIWGATARMVQNLIELL